MSTKFKFLQMPESFSFKATYNVEFKDAVKDAYTISEMLGKPVKLDFNGVVLTISADPLIAKTYEDAYDNALNKYLTNSNV